MYKIIKALPKSVLPHSNALPDRTLVSQHTLQEVDPSSKSSACNLNGFLRPLMDSLPRAVQWEPRVRNNINNPAKIPLKLKSREISFNNNIHLVAGSFWNFAQSTAVWLPCSVQNCGSICLLQQMLHTNTFIVYEEYRTDCPYCYRSFDEGNELFGAVFAHHTTKLRLTDIKNKVTA